MAHLQSTKYMYLQTIDTAAYRNEQNKMVCFILTKLFEKKYSKTCKFQFIAKFCASSAFAIVYRSNVTPRMSVKSNITPLTLGLISEPPTLVLVYEESEVLPLPGHKVKRRKRKIPLRNFTDKSSAEKTARTIHLRHEKYLEQVPVILVEKLLRIIQEIIKGLQPDEAAEKVDAEYAINPEEDLNKASETDLSKKKLIMEESFEKNRLRPTDPGYSYDKQIDFDRIRKVKSGWDDDEEAQERPPPEPSESTTNSSNPPAFSKLQPLMEKISLLAQEDMNNSQLGITDETNLIETIVDNDDDDDFW